MFSAFGAIDWKPFITALLLPPVPLLVLLVVGMVLRWRRPLAGLAVITVSLLLMWFSHCQATANWLERRWLRPPAALTPERLQTLRRSLAGQRPVVVVLGGGREVYSPEFGDASLSDQSLQRLLYAQWLSRRLDAPVLFSGGTGRDQRGDVAEATVAARVAERDLGRALRWTETQSRDTRGNARLSLPILAAHGATDVLLVTHAWHMPRALRAFDEAAGIGGLTMRLVPAPIASGDSSLRTGLLWMPTADGYRHVRAVLREFMALAAGA